MKRRLSEKLNLHNGETLVETLIALLISVLAMTALPAAVNTSTKINLAAKDSQSETVLLSESDAEEIASITVTVSDGSDSTSVSVTGYKNNGFYYYE